MTHILVILQVDDQFALSRLRVVTGVRIIYKLWRFEAAQVRVAPIRPLIGNSNLGDLYGMQTVVSLGQRGSTASKSLIRSRKKPWGRVQRGCWDGRGNREWRTEYPAIFCDSKERLRVGLWSRACSTSFAFISSM